MKAALKFVSYLGLALSVGPAFLVFRGVIGLQTNMHLMTVGMLLWFGTAPFWMKRERPGD